MSLFSHAKRHAADAMRYACFRSSLLDVAIATECNAPAFFTLGSAVAIARNSDSDRLVRFGDGFLSAAVAHSDNIMHNIISIVFIDLPPSVLRLYGSRRRRGLIVNPSFPLWTRSRQQTPKLPRPQSQANCKPLHLLRNFYNFHNLHTNSLPVPSPHNQGIS
jgi:hypothetical protein